MVSVGAAPVGETVVPVIGSVGAPEGVPVPVGGGAVGGLVGGTLGGPPTNPSSGCTLHDAVVSL